MAFRLRPSMVAAGFTVLVATIASLSWATAQTTAGPWFDVTVSLAVYAIAIALGSLLAVILVLQASVRAASLDASLRRLDRRIAMLHAVPRVRGVDPRLHHVPVPDDVDPGPRAFASDGSPALVGLEKEGHDSLVSEVRGARPAAEARTEVLRLLVRERIALREARTGVWETAAGPVVLSVIFLMISGPMLPGAGGFAVAHYQLNTALILFLAYSFAPLVAWSVLSIGMMGTATHREPLWDAAGRHLGPVPSRQVGPRRDT